MYARTFFTLLTHFFLASSVIAQNALFFDFALSFEEVLENLESIPDVRVLDEVTDQSIRAQCRLSAFTYYFHQGQLYRVDMERQFFRKGKARKAYSSCREYLDMVTAKTLHQVESNQLFRRVKTRQGRLFDLQLKRAPLKTYRLVLSSRRPILGPWLEWDGFDLQALLRGGEPFSHILVAQGLSFLGRF